MLIRTAILFSLALALCTSCKVCSTCDWVQVDTLSGDTLTGTYGEACGKKKEIIEFEDSAKAVGAVVGRTVNCSRD